MAPLPNKNDLYKFDFRTVKVQFDSTAGDKQSETGTVTFGNDVLDAEAAIRGFTVEYSNTSHDIRFEEARIVSAKPKGSQVTVEVALGLRRDSRKFNDPYEGTVDVLVVAKVADTNASAA